MKEMITKILAEGIIDTNLIKIPLKTKLVALYNLSYSLFSHRIPQRTVIAQQTKKIRPSLQVK